MVYYELMGMVGLFMTATISGTFKAIFAKDAADRYAAFTLITFGILILGCLAINVIVRSNIVVK